MGQREHSTNPIVIAQTTKAFLGDMLADDHGHIVTVASVAGLMGTYRCTDYSASKFAAVGFHESLFTELQVKKLPFYRPSSLIPSCSLF